MLPKGLFDEDVRAGKVRFIRPHFRSLSDKNPKVNDPARLRSLLALGELEVIIGGGTYSGSSLENRSGGKPGVHFMPELEEGVLVGDIKFRLEHVALLRIKPPARLQSDFKNSKPVNMTSLTRMSAKRESMVRLPTSEVKNYTKNDLKSSVPTTMQSTNAGTTSPTAVRMHTVTSGRLASLTPVQRPQGGLRPSISVEDCPDTVSNIVSNEQMWSRLTPRQEQLSTNRDHKSSSESAPMDARALVDPDEAFDLSRLSMEGRKSDIMMAKRREGPIAELMLAPKQNITPSSVSNINNHQQGFDPELLSHHGRLHSRAESNLSNNRGTNELPISSLDDPSTEPQQKLLINFDTIKRINKLISRRTGDRIDQRLSYSDRFIDEK